MTLGNWKQECGSQFEGLRKSKGVVVEKQRTREIKMTTMWHSPWGCFNKRSVGEDIMTRVSSGEAACQKNWCAVLVRLWPLPELRLTSVGFRIVEASGEAIEDDYQS